MRQGQTNKLENEKVVCLIIANGLIYVDQCEMLHVLSESMPVDFVFCPASRFH